MMRDQGFEATDQEYDSSPLVLVIADSADASSRAQDATIHAGARVGVRAAPGDNIADILSNSRFAAIVAELGNGGADIASLLADIEHAAHADYIPAVVTVPTEHIDLASARLVAPSIMLLCNPDPVERAGALALALAEATPRGVRDANAEQEAMRLRRLADEVGRIAKALSALSVTGNGDRPALRGSVADMAHGFDVGPDFGAIAGENADGAIGAADLRATIRLRRLRDRFFDSAMFADPAWDILLDLMAARLERVQVAVSSLCIAAAVPPTTALRWIKAMTEARLLERVADPDDGRRIFIRLTDAAAAEMNRYFVAASMLSGRII